MSGKVNKTKKPVNIQAFCVKMHYIDILKTIKYQVTEKGLKPDARLMQKVKDITELINVLETIS
jgi:hypothetical protein